RLGVPQPGDADGGHGRVLGADEPLPDRADLAGVGAVAVDVDDVDRDAGEVVARAPRGRERLQEVQQGLLELGDDVVADDRPGPVERGLAGEVDGAAAVGDNGVAEPARRGELRRVDAFERHDWTAPPSTLMPCPLIAPFCTQASTAAATSSGCTSRWLGWRRSSTARASASDRPVRCAMAATVASVMGVST